MSVLAGWLRVALRDLRGDLSHFGVLLACLALGVGAIAAVGSVGEALQAAIGRDSRVVLGGDLEGQLSYRPADAAERALFDQLGTYAEVIDVPGRARTEDGGSSFISVKGVDASYPLLGAVDVTVAEEAPLPTLLEQRDGAFGILVNSLLIDRMGLGTGTRLEIGDAVFEVRGILDGVPDQATQGIQIGVPTLMSIEGINATGLIHPGALARFRYKLLLDPDVTFASAESQIRAAFPDASWDIRSPTQATETLANFFSIFTRFLVIVGLSSLLVGGVGVSNAVGAYIIERQRSIATLRSLGATSARILTHFLFQIMLLTLLGIAIGLALGAVLSLIALPIIGNLLSIRLDAAVHVSSLLTAAGFGLLVGFAFAFLPLARAKTLRPALLFRSAGGAVEGWRWRDALQPGVWIPLLAAAAGIVGLALLTTGRPELVFWYTLGAVVAFLVLRLAAAGLQWALRQVPPLPNASLRNALIAIHRPGAPAPAVILSLGLGLALLLLIALIENNLRTQIESQVQADAPTFILTDLFEDEADAFTALATTDERIQSFYSTPMMRAAIVNLSGRPVAEYKPYPEDIGFLFEGEAPITWQRSFPPGASALDEGDWWPSDYDGPALVSLSTEFRDRMGLGIGDTIEVRLFGDPIIGTISSFRRVDWASGINFAVIFSPGVIEQFPVNFIGMIKAADGREREVQTMLVQDFPDLNFIAVGDAIQVLTAILGTLSDAVSIVGSIAVVSGLFVLAGAMAAGRAQREADAVVMKVLGATRGDVVRAFLIEYGVLGALAAILAAVLGSVGAWAFVTQVLEMNFSIDPLLIVSVVAGAVILTIAVGTVMTWTALSVKPAGYLRGE